MNKKELKKLIREVVQEMIAIQPGDDYDLKKLQSRIRDAYNVGGRNVVDVEYSTDTTDKEYPIEFVVNTHGASDTEWVRILTDHDLKFFFVKLKWKGAPKPFTWPALTQQKLFKSLKAYS